MGIRAALAFATAEKYFAAVLFLGTTAIVARIVSPEEFGVVAIGAGAIALADAMRQFGTAAYIVQTRELTTEGVRVVFTMGLIFTLAVVAAILAAAPAIAAALGIPGADDYLRVAVIALVLGTLSSPVYGLLAREMKFNRIALVNVISAAVNAASLVTFAVLGFSFMSFAWANVCSASVGVACLLALRGEAAFFRPSFSGWSEVLRFGSYTGGQAMLQTGSQYAALVVIGAMLSSAAVGLLHRASMICQFPERVILAGVNAVALPAFSESARRDEDLAALYLGAIERLTALIWPGLGVLVLIAYPLVRLVLGEDWIACAPLVQIIAAGLLLNFPPGINYPVIIATGDTRRAFLLSVLQVSLTLPIVYLAARVSLEAVAWSTFLVVGINVVTSTVAVSQVVPLSLPSLGRAMSGSAAVAAVALGPCAAFVLLTGGPDALGVPGMAVVLAMAAAGWLAGLRLMDHPALGELARARSALRRRFSAGAG